VICAAAYNASIAAVSPGSIIGNSPCTRLEYLRPEPVLNNTTRSLG
jgi:hypothetical protein